MSIIKKNSPSEAEILRQIENLSFSPLHIQQLSAKDIPEEAALFRNHHMMPDAVLEIKGEGIEERFVVECKSRWSSATVQAALVQVERYAHLSLLRPLILVPYLSEEQLLELEAQKVSGLDLCGNGIVVVPGKYTVFRTGKPNRFTTSAPIKNVYRGDTSLVARAFMLRMNFASVKELSEFIRIRGGRISPATISKALRAMEDDLVIFRHEKTLRSLQPNKLLSLLEANHVPMKQGSLVIGRAFAPTTELQELKKILVKEAREQGIALIATGVSSAPYYVALAMEEKATLYCSTEPFLSISFQHTTRFPNFELIETSEQSVFFDARVDEAGYPWASPIQAYLEMATGEPRLKQSASALREEILRDLQESDVK